MLRLLLRKRHPAKPDAISTTGLAEETVRLMRQARRGGVQVGVMFVAVSSIASDDGVPSPSIKSYFKAELARLTRTTVYEIDQHILACASANEDVVLFLDRVTLALRSELRNRRATTIEFTPVWLTTGVAVSEQADVSPGDLLAGARSALYLAEANKRDTYFRRIWRSHHAAV